MKSIAALSLAILLTLVAGCADRAPEGNDPRAAEFKSRQAPPPRAARVYVLPTVSKGLFGDLDGKETIFIFPDASEQGTKLGATDKSRFVAFDIGPGRYDLLAKAADPLARVTEPFTFDAGKTYYLRPSFFRSAAELSSSGQKAGMTFDRLAAADGAQAVASLDMAQISQEGGTFLAQTFARPAVVAPAPVASPPAGAAMPAAPPATAGSSAFSTVERKLRELKALRDEGLITPDQYAAKQKVILESY